MIETTPDFWYIIFVILVFFIGLTIGYFSFRGVNSVRIDNIIDFLTYLVKSLEDGKLDDEEKTNLINKAMEIIGSFRKTEW